MIKLLLITVYLMFLSFYTWNFYFGTGKYAAGFENTSDYQIAWLPRLLGLWLLPTLLVTLKGIKILKNKLFFKTKKTT